MTLRSIAVFLALGPVALAQRPNLEVQDLVLSEARGGGSGARDIVLRAFHGIDTDEEGQPWHRVSGEGHLAPWINEWQDELEPRGIYTEDSLGSVLAALRGTSRSSIDFQRFGDTVLLDTEYPEQLAGALAEVRRALPPRIRVEVTLERVTPEGAETLLNGAQSFGNGEVRVIADVAKKRILRDFDVEIAQAAATANPILGEVRHGASVTLRARPVPFRDEAIVEAVVRTASAVPTPPLAAHPAIGPLDRAASRVDEGGFAFRIGRDQQTQHEWTTLDGTRMRLTCDASWAEPAPIDDDAETIIVCSSLLGAPVLGFRSTTAEEPEEPRESTSVQEIVEHTRSAVGRDAVPLFEPGESNGGGVMLLSGTGGRRYRRMLEDRLDHALRPARVQLEILDVPADAEFTEGGPRPAGARTIATLSGPLLVAHPVCFASAREQSYVRDWDVEVAQASRIPDPKVDIVEEGWFGTVRAEADPSGRVRTLHVDLQVEVLEELRVLSTSLNWAMSALAPVTDDSRTPSMWMPQDVLSLELPIERSIAVHAVVDLDEDGSAMLRRSASSLFGPGRMLVVRARVE